jgi:polyferredoxin
MDACDSIMEKVDLPKGLIKYSSELNISKNKKLKFTSRIKAYSVLLLSLLILLGVMIGTRSDITTTLTKAKGSLYSMTDNGHVRNIYEIQLINKTQFEYPVELKVISPEGGTIIVAGKKVLLKKEERVVQTIIIEIPQDKLTGYSTSVKIGVYHQDKLLSTETCRFLGP